MEYDWLTADAFLASYFVLRRVCLYIVDKRTECHQKRPEVITKIRKLVWNIRFTLLRL